MYMYFLAALAFALALVVVVSTVRKGRTQSLSDRVGGFGLAVLLALLGAGVTFVANGAVRAAQQEAENERIRQEASVPAPQIDMNAPAPEPEPEVPISEPEPTPQVTEAAPAPASTGYTDAQNLAIAADRDPNDPEIAQKYARLDALCPDETPTTADLVVNLRNIVRNNSGRELDLVNVLDQLIIAQEGAPAGMSCKETGAALSILMEEGL
ncbi:hypothetical protein WDJ50_18495 (plasmid) [Deinococcus sp. VB142]|uniref:Uncharacterized protein n=1 Tax=Deinococcus sp. VB142 TaxID=3112952 RepID=A0AAU6Q898_9DEIO